MQSGPSSDRYTQHRAVLPRLARWAFRLLRMFWLTALLLLSVYVYGRFAGWATPRQWSDAYC